MTGSPGFDLDHEAANFPSRISARPAPDAPQAAALVEGPVSGVFGDGEGDGYSPRPAEWPTRRDVG